MHAHIHNEETNNTNTKSHYPNQRHFITREIGIDAGHRVTFHGSKCRNLHGHRYTIEATCVGPLFTEGEQQGMVLDFGFLKEEMVRECDEPCDHGMILWIDDPFTLKLALGGDSDILARVREAVQLVGYHQLRLNVDDNTGGKYYIVPFVPTAENLAKHWFERLAARVTQRTDNQASLYSVKVYETPNCSAQYPTNPTNPTN